jgi:tripartite-type tricarboxylate transporter receptor subunit TctC
VDWYTPSYSAIVRYIRSGDMKILLATRKLKEFPSVPTGPEVGVPSFSFNMWVGMFVHSKTPKLAYERLVAAVKKVSEEPEIAKKLADLGINLDYKDPRGFSNFINDQWEGLDDLIKKTGMKAE